MAAKQEPAAITAVEYGDSYRQDFLTLYQSFVASADKISDRRDTANKFFLSLNTALLGFVSALLPGSDGLLWITAVAGLALCATWHSVILSHKSLNKAKFAVILEMEKQLPAATYGDEWAQFEKNIDPIKHTPFSDLETRVPVIFAWMHGVVLLGGFTQWVINLVVWATGLL